jgi:hypothetical protein
MTLTRLPATSSARSAVISSAATAVARCLALTTVAAAAGRAGARDEALNAAEEARVLFEREPPDDEEERDRLLESMVSGWAAMREFSRALATAGAIRDQAVAAEAQVEIACELARFGNAPEAVALAQRVLVEPERASTRRL